MVNEKNLELNLTDDNNFFVSNTFVEAIKYKLKENSSYVTHEETEILKKVEKRKEICKELNIHYFVLPDPSTSEGAFCHWCNITAVEYSIKLRAHTRDTQ